nr:MAG TPA: minor capsid protein [Caudoviricetes sp.]
MNIRQKEVLQQELNNEKKTIKELEQVYQQAIKDCEKKIRELSMRSDMENIQSIIYQKQYQQAIKGQLEGVLSQLHSNEFATVSEYLNKCYTDGFVGSMYDLAGQGIPLIVPINQNRVVKAIQLDSKLSKTLYESLGEDVGKLKTAVRAQVSRGISNGSSWNDIAKTLAERNMKNTPFGTAINNAIRIARTEGHRVQTSARVDAMSEAKKKGADVVKQWDSTLDGRTRTTHRQLDGQIRELDEPFEVEGMKVDAPGMFGNPAEDCNCRCAVLQRARWALDETELDTLKERAEYFELDKSKDFEDYKSKYLNISEEDIRKADLTASFIPAQTIEEAEEYIKQFIGNGYSPIFKNQVIYKGISVENANEINKVLTELYSQYDLPKISGIKTISPTSTQGKKVFSSSDAVAAYNPIEHGIFINKNVLKNATALASYNEEAEKAWNLVMSNIDNLSGKEKELALLYKNAGRALVGNGSVHDYIIHEMGHHVQWNVLDTKINNAMGSSMSIYAPKISGYANASKSEYIAESFAAYIKGETKLLDPDFVKAINDYNKPLEKVARSSKITSGAISGARNPYGEKAEEHAKRYYGLVRSMKTDVSKISKVTGMDEKDIQGIKDFIFFEKHDLGGKELEYFEPDYMMAESWQRLIEGKPEAHDITMLKHEILEKELIKNGMTQEQAHIEASMKYNYSKEAGEYYAKIEKYKKE